MHKQAQTILHPLLQINNTLAINNLQDINKANITERQYVT